MTLVSLRSPLTSLGAFLLAAYLPEVLQFAARPTGGVVQTSHSGSWGQLLGGMQLSDIALVGMLAAVFLIFVGHLTPSARARAATRLSPAVWLPAALFAAWLGVEVVRNVRQFGIASPGEFRFEYLGLAVVPYLCVVSRDAVTQRRMLWLLLAATLWVPLALVPVIGALKGWYVGPSSRFFPADVSLGSSSAPARSCWRRRARSSRCRRGWWAPACASPRSSCLSTPTVRRGWQALQRYSSRRCCARRLAARSAPRVSPLPSRSAPLWPYHGWLSPRSRSTRPPGFNLEGALKPRRLRADSRACLRQTVQPTPTPVRGLPCGVPPSARFAPSRWRRRLWGLRISPCHPRSTTVRRSLSNPTTSTSRPG